MTSTTRDDDAMPDDSFAMPVIPPGFPRPFGPYVLLSPIAQGGMGEVFLAARPAPIAGGVRLVVVKTLRPDLAKEKGYVGRFLDEARVALQLAHSNIAHVFDAGVHDGVTFLAMEHIAGVTLRDLIVATLAGIPAPLALMIASEVLDGLDAAHRHKNPLTGEALGIVHRDVSPQNVMLTYDGEVKVIDFGLAESKLKQEHTESNIVLGKIAYMSPEQARGEDVDARSDQYSASVMLYELLTGERFYADRTHREIWLVAGDPPEAPKMASLDPALRRILAIGLAKKPADRWPSCGTFATALRSFLHERFPGADRAMLRAFVGDVVRDERTQFEKTLRALAPLVPAHTPPTLAPTSSRERTASFLAPPSPEEPSTIEPSLMAEAGLHRRRSTIVAAGVVATLVIAAAVLLVAQPAPAVAPASPSTTQATTTAFATPAPIVSASDVPAPVEGPAPAPKIDETAPKPKATSTKPVANVPHPIAAPPPKPAPTPTTADAPIAAVATTTTEAPPDEGPPWKTWSVEQKWLAIASSSSSCARGLRKLREGGVTPGIAALDACLPQALDAK